MDMIMLGDFFMWCTLINSFLMLYFLLLIKFMPEMVYRVQTKIVPMERQAFNHILYGFLGLFKVFVVVFNFTPFIVIKFLL